MEKQTNPQDNIHRHLHFELRDSSEKAIDPFNYFSMETKTNLANNIKKIYIEMGLDPIQDVFENFDLETKTNLVNNIKKIYIERGMGPVQEALRKMETYNPSLKNSIQDYKNKCYVNSMFTEVYRTGTDFMTNQPTYNVRISRKKSKPKIVGYIHQKGGAGIPFTRPRI